MSFPRRAKDTGHTVLGCHTYTDETLPKCNRCFVMSGLHAKTKERGWYAFCKKSGKLQKIGPYETFHKALKTLTLTQGCDTCDFNTSDAKTSYLSLLKERIQEELQETMGDEQVLHFVMGSLECFVKYRDYLDVNFKDSFGFRLFNTLPDDCIAIVSSIKPCNDDEDFSLKIQALAGIFDRMNIDEMRKLIKDKTKQNLKGSINLLEQILKENVPNYPKSIIFNLRNLMSLRSKMYPVHATSAEILVILRNLGINNYPLDDWEKGWKKIFSLCSNSLVELVEAFQTVKKA